MCQVLGLEGARKYEHSGGPGMAQIGGLIRTRSAQPVRVTPWRPSQPG